MNPDRFLGSSDPVGTQSVLTQLHRQTFLVSPSCEAVLTTSFYVIACGVRSRTSARAWRMIVGSRCRILGSMNGCGSRAASIRRE
jgi:hypothetical protein